jgi:hypothetical protein
MLIRDTNKEWGMQRHNKLELVSTKRYHSKTMKRKNKKKEKERTLLYIPSLHAKHAPIPPKGDRDSNYKTGTLI